MVMLSYRGVFRNGQIQFEEDADLNEGDEVIVTVVKENPDSEVQGITAQQILESGMIGIWADRDDIADSAEFAEELRRRSNMRSHDDD